MPKILIKNGRLIDPVNKIDKVLDLLIENGKIGKIDKSIDNAIEDDDKVINASGRIVIPGLVDMHAHFRDPGYTDDEDLESGSKCAALGGFTTVAVMPDTNPIIDNIVVLEYIISKAHKLNLVNIIPLGAISKCEAGKELSKLWILKRQEASFSSGAECLNSS
jgi:dihydroorotase